MNNIYYQIIAYNSHWHVQSLALRYKILRAPLGLKYAYDDLLKEVNQIHFAAIREDEVIGVCLLQKINTHQAKLRQFAIAENCQKSGIGKALLLYAEEYARQQHYTEIILHARQTAMGFYQKNGYAEMGDIFHEVGLPHFKMQKLIC
ncbi:MAG: GNAT family N-acetyltransferase [Chitinophagales bacterium]